MRSNVSAQSKYSKQNKIRDWIRNHPQEHSSHKNDSHSLQNQLTFLKTVTKNIELITKMQKKSKIHISTSCSTRSRQTVLKTEGCESNKPKKITNLKEASEIYLKDKKKNNEVLEGRIENDGIDQRRMNRQHDNKLEGLLGQYSRYQMMSKKELIQKLISLQYLANTIFREKKLLQEEIDSLKRNQTSTCSPSLQ